MSSLAPARPRGRLFSRFHCSRSGHEWERQILDSGAEARWVCTTCGKLGDEIPVITPEQEVVEMSETSETSTPVDETVDAEPNASEAAEQPDPDVVSAEALRRGVGILAASPHDQSRCGRSGVGDRDQRHGAGVPASQAIAPSLPF